MNSKIMNWKTTCFLILIVFNGLSALSQENGGFIAGSNYTVWITELEEYHDDLDSITGTGRVRWHDEDYFMLPVEFENIKLEQSGGMLYLKRGAVYGSFKDTFRLRGEEEQFIANYCYTDSVLINRNEAKMKLRFTPKYLFNGDTVQRNFEDWIYSSNYRPWETVIMKDTILRSGDFRINCSNQKISMYRNKYKLKFNGTVDYISDEKTFTFNIPQDTTDITYLTSGRKYKIPLNERLSFYSKGMVMDASTEKSPGYFSDNPEWSGIMIDSLQFRGDHSIFFDFLIPEKKHYRSSSWQAYAEDGIFNIDLNAYAESISGEYNTFETILDTIDIDYRAGLNNWNVKGSLKIPYYKYMQKFFIPYSNASIQLAKSRDNAEYQPFPMNEFAFDNFGMYHSDSIIPAIIDHESKEIELALPLEYFNQNISADFDFKGKKILIDGKNLVKKGQIALSNLSEDHSLEIHSLGGEMKQYDLYIREPRKIELSSANNMQGTTTGEGTYVYNTPVTITAEAAENYEFDQWKDTDDAYYSKHDTLTINLVKDMELIAHFEGPLASNTLYEANPVKLYPNPASSHITLEGLKGNYTITIFNIAGKKVLEKTATQAQENINTTSLQPGIYSIQITDRKGRAWSKRLVIQ